MQGDIRFRGPMDYVVPDDSTMIFNNMDAEMGLSLPLDYNTNEFVQSGLVQRRRFRV